MRVLKGAAEAGEACPDRQSRPSRSPPRCARPLITVTSSRVGPGSSGSPSSDSARQRRSGRRRSGAGPGSPGGDPAAPIQCWRPFPGASLAGVAAHFVLWPHKRGFAGVPELTKADGLASWQMPTYNTILRAWALASAGSIALEVPRGSRRWSLLGGALLPLFVVSARHHFKWVKEQAASNPAWWNRGVALGDTSS